MASNFGNLLGVIGPLLTCCSVVLQLVEWRLARKDSSELSLLEDHIGEVSGIIDDLGIEDKRPGFVTREGIDIGQAFAIMEAGSVDANKINRKKLRELKDKQDVAFSNREHIAAISFAAGLIGTVMWAAASFV